MSQTVGRADHVCVFSKRSRHWLQTWKTICNIHNGGFNHVRVKHISQQKTLEINIAGVACSTSQGTNKVTYFCSAGAPPSPIAGDSLPHLASFPWEYGLWAAQLGCPPRPHNISDVLAPDPVHPSSEATPQGHPCTGGSSYSSWNCHRCGTWRMLQEPIFPLPSPWCCPGHRQRDRGRPLPPAYDN